MGDMIVPIVIPMLLYGLDLLLRFFSIQKEASIAHVEAVTDEIVR